MKCNACWQELEGRAFSTTCGHLFCHEDATKILSNDSTCPICDQVLSKSLIKSVDTNPGDEWTNMAMVGISPQILMKSMYKSVTFCMGQKELEMQYKMNRIISQYKQKLEGMQEKFSEKFEQLHSAYQKMGKRCQMMQQEIETLTKDKQELQEKYAEKSRQKRKLDEMYDQLRGEYDSIKRSAIQPANHNHNNNNNNNGNNFFRRQDPDLFSSINMTGKREEIWGKKRNASPFDICNNSPGNMGPQPAGEPGSRRQTPMAPNCPSFGSGLNLNNHNSNTNHHGFLQKTAGAANNTSNATLRNLMMSPLKRPQNPNRHNLFTL